MNDLISIIVPVYNVENYLKECVDSILKQTYDNIEVIIVDDGSTDNSGKICDEYAKLDARVKVIHKKNGGLADARNTGLRYVTGNFVGFVDSDDFIEKDMYDFLYKKIKEFNADIAVCSSYDYYGDFGKHNKIDNIKIECDNKKAYEIMVTPKYFGCGVWNKLYKRKIIEGIEFPYGRINGEDFIWISKVLLNTNKVYYESIPKYYYRYRKDSLSRKKELGMGLVESIKEFMDMIENNDNEMYKLTVNTYVLACFQIYNNCIKLKNNNEKKSWAKEEIKKYKKMIQWKKYTRNKRLQLLFFYYCNPLYEIIAGPIKRRIDSIK